MNRLFSPAKVTRNGGPQFGACLILSEFLPQKMFREVFIVTETSGQDSGACLGDTWHAAWKKVPHGGILHCHVLLTSLGPHASSE